MPSLKKRRGKHAQKRTATGTTPSVRPPVRKRKSSDRAEHTAFDERSLIFCYGATDRVFYRWRTIIVSEQCGKKMGSDRRIMLVSTPIGEIALSQFPKVEIECKRFELSCARRFAVSCSGGACHICKYVDLLTADGWNFTGNRYFFYGVSLHEAQTLYTDRAKGACSTCPASSLR
jgi:hypothetical protein